MLNLKAKQIVKVNVHASTSRKSTTPRKPDNNNTNNQRRFLNCKPILLSFLPPNTSAAQITNFG